MAYHVEIRQGIRRAWAFNLDSERLRTILLDPPRRGARIELGDREWDPNESRLRILEGPELAPADLAHGGGWHQAESSSHEVTAEVLGRAAAESVVVAVLAETPTAIEIVAPLLEELQMRRIDWAALRARILATASVVGTSGPASHEHPIAILVAERRDPSADWLFDAGLALGALGGRAILAQLGDEPAPEPMRDLAVVRLDPARPGAAGGLAERLRAAAVVSS